MLTPSEGLSHPYHVVRLQAVAEAHARLGAEPWGLWAELGGLLDDPHREVRAAVARALAEAAQSEDGVLLELAGRAGSASPRARLAALFAIELSARMAPSPGGARWEAARQAAEVAARDANPHLRYQALTSLAALAAEEASVRSLALGALGDGDGEVVAAAAELLADLEAIEASAAVHRALGRLRRDARRRALLALARLLALTPEAGRDADAWREVRRALLGEARGLPFALGALEALAVLGDGESERQIERLARGWLTHRLIRVAASAALVRRRHPAGEALLRGLLRHRSRDARGYAIEQAGRWGGAAFEPDLVAILRARGDYHADTAAWALGLGPPRAESTLMALREAERDPREEVREEAQRALLRLSLPPAGEGPEASSSPEDASGRG